MKNHPSPGSAQASSRLTIADETLILIADYAAERAPRPRIPGPGLGLPSDVGERILREAEKVKGGVVRRPRAPTAALLGFFARAISDVGVIDFDDGSRILWRRDRADGAWRLSSRVLSGAARPHRFPLLRLDPSFWWRMLRRAAALDAEPCIARAPGTQPAAGDRPTAWPEHWPGAPEAAAGEVLGERLGAISDALEGRVLEGWPDDLDKTRIQVVRLGLHCATPTAAARITGAFGLERDGAETRDLEAQTTIVATTILARLNARIDQALPCPAPMAYGYHQPGGLGRFDTVARVVPESRDLAPSAHARLAGRRLVEALNLLAPPAAG